MTGDMNAATSQRIERACQVVAKAVNQDSGGLCLDVGCGFGVFVPFLVCAGVPAPKIHGVDLSPDMIRNAQEQHGLSKVKSPTFTACDSLNDYDGPAGDGASLFRAAIFCSFLHDLPDPNSALTKATSLLDVGGKIVIVHPQGASHVLQQVRSNPVSVRRGLLDAEELRALPNLQLVIEPAVAASVQVSKEGYLAVLEKVE
jgi:ubiquinone/menaquinone biosynthesis C-methylase UbiE